MTFDASALSDCAFEFDSLISINWHNSRSNSFMFIASSNRDVSLVWLLKQRSSVVKIITSVS